MMRPATAIARVDDADSVVACTVVDAGLAAVHFTTATKHNSVTNRVNANDLAISSASFSDDDAPSIRASSGTFFIIPACGARAGK